jgi:dihydrofolate reductase
MVAYGGAKFVSSLIKNNLIDEYHLMINPTAIGKGMPIFNELPRKPSHLNLSDCLKFDCGIALLKYTK